MGVEATVQLLPLRVREQKGFWMRRDAIPNVLCELHPFLHTQLEDVLERH